MELKLSSGPISLDATQISKAVFLVNIGQFSFRFFFLFSFSTKVYVSKKNSVVAILVFFSRSFQN